MAIKDTLRAMDETDVSKFDATDEETVMAAGDRDGNPVFQYQRSFVVTNINEA